MSEWTRAAGRGGGCRSERQSASSHSTRKARTGRSMFFRVSSPSATSRALTRPCTASRSARDTRMPPGVASASSRAAMLTRRRRGRVVDDVRRRYAGRYGRRCGYPRAHRRWRQPSACWNSMAAPSASTALANSASAVAGGLDQPAAMSRQRRQQALGTMSLQPLERAAFVAPHQARVADHVRRQDCRQSALLSRHRPFLLREGANLARKS